jgi:hypothetical protein
MEDDWRRIANKRGATRLGFAVMLKFFELEARSAGRGRASGLGRIGTGSGGKRGGLDLAMPVESLSDEQAAGFGSVRGGAEAAGVVAVVLAR